MAIHPVGSRHELGVQARSATIDFRRGRELLALDLMAQGVIAANSREGAPQSVANATDAQAWPLAMRY